MISKAKRQELNIPGKAKALAEVWTKHLQQQIGCNVDKENSVYTVFCNWGWDPKVCKSRGFQSLTDGCFSCKRSVVTEHPPLKPNTATIWKPIGKGEMHPTA